MKWLSQALKVHFQTFQQNSDWNLGKGRQRKHCNNAHNDPFKEESEQPCNETGLNVRLDQTVKGNLSPAHHKASNV